MSQNLPSKRSNNFPCLKDKINGPVWVIINKHSGTSMRLNQSRFDRLIRFEFERMGFEPVVFWEESSRFQERVRIFAQSDSNVLIIGGGDGTISNAANIIHGTQKILGLIPLGTRNHLAQDLRCPLEFRKALRILLKSQVRPIDVGQVNNRIFINNASIGIYPYVVFQRQYYQKYWKISKRLAMTFGFLAAILEMPNRKVQICTDTLEMDIDSPLIFLGNNDYQLEWETFGRRPNLHELTSTHFFSMQQSKLLPYLPI